MDWDSGSKPHVGLRCKVHGPGLEGVPVVPRVPPEWQEASVLGVGLEEQPEENAQCEPVGQVEVVGTVGHFPLEFLGDGYCEAGNDLDVDPLSEPLAKFSGEALALLQEVLDRSPFGESGRRERKVQEGGVLASKECEIDLEVGFSLTPPPHPNVR